MFQVFQRGNGSKGGGGEEGSRSVQIIESMQSYQVQTSDH